MRVYGTMFSTGRRQPCIVASAMLVRLGRIDQAAGRRGTFRLKGLAGLLLGAAALVVQAVGWTHQGFGPADGG